RGGLQHFSNRGVISQNATPAKREFGGDDRDRVFVVRQFQHPSSSVPPLDSQMPSLGDDRAPTESKPLDGKLADKDNFQGPPIKEDDTESKAPNIAPVEQQPETETHDQKVKEQADTPQSALNLD